MQTVQTSVSTDTKVARITNRNNVKQTKTDLGAIV